MGRNSTRLQVAFFCVLITGYVLLQYAWVQSIQKEKEQHFKENTVSAIALAGEKFASRVSNENELHALIAPTLQQSFIAKSLGSFRFEYQLTMDHKQYTSNGFTRLLADKPGQLTFRHTLSDPKSPSAATNQLTVIIPFAKKAATKDMMWTKISAVLLTLLLLVILSCAWYWGHRRQHLFQANRRKTIEQMISQLKAPLESLSLATENLQKATTSTDPAQITNQQKVIQREGKRINELLRSIFSKFE